MQAHAAIPACLLTAAFAACSSPARPPLRTTDRNDVSPASGGPGNGGDAGAVPPSCQSRGDGMTSCGASGESCCTSLEVAGGTFYRTYTNDGGGAVGEADGANIGRFRLDKYDVTVGRFRQFVSAVLPPDGGVGWLPSEGAGKHSHLHGGTGLSESGTNANETGWLTADDGKIAPTDANLACDGGAPWTASPRWSETVPITCVNWYEAYAFCIWDGGFLPTEAEWEYATAGGNEEREYPWGSTEPGTANEYAIYGSHYSPPGVSGNLAPVGTASLGGGRWGQLDLTGNVSTWTLDGAWYPRYIGPCVDCVYAPGSSVRVIAGANYQTGPESLPPTNRDSGVVAPSTRRLALGFRCARAPS